MKRKNLVSDLVLVRDKVDIGMGKVSVKEPFIEVSAILRDIIDKVIAGPVEE